MIVTVHTFDYNRGGQTFLAAGQRAYGNVNKDKKI